MKGANGIFEIVFIVVLMLASVPLIMLLVMTINNSKMNYLDDKTAIEVSNVIDYTVDGSGHYVMNYRGNAELNLAQTVLMLSHFDQYGAALDTTGVYTKDSAGNDVVYDITDRVNSLNRDMFYRDLFTTNPQSVGVATILSDPSHYLYYDSTTGKWLITTDNISIYE